MAGVRAAQIALEAAMHGCYAAEDAHACFYACTRAYVYAQSHARAHAGLGNLSPSEGPCYFFVWRPIAWDSCSWGTVSPSVAGPLM